MGWGETLQKCHSNLTFKKCPPGWSGRRCSWPLEEKEGEEDKCTRKRERMIDV